MSNVKNKVVLTGFVGADPVIIELPNEKRMARVSLAVNEYYRDGTGEFVNKTQWFSLILWNKKINLIEGVVKKGTGISIEGKLSNQNYIDKNGEQRFSTEIVVYAIELMMQSGE